MAIVIEINVADFRYRPDVARTTCSKYCLCLYCYCYSLVLFDALNLRRIKNHVECLLILLHTNQRTTE